MSMTSRSRLFALLFSVLCATYSCTAFQLQPQSVVSNRSTKLHSTSDGDATNAEKIFFDIAIPTPDEEIPLGRLTFHLTPSTNPNYLPLHISNLVSLAAGQRKAIDPKATYEGCSFQYSPATIEDGSFRYRWGHVCEGYGRNGIQTTSASGIPTSWDEPFSDPERIKECSHSCSGGVYYGQRYDEIVNELQNDGQSVAVLLTVPISGPGAGTSKFSVVRVSESPREWGEQLLLNSAVVGYLDCSASATGTVGDEEESGTSEGTPTSLDVLQAMARQRVGPPKIVKCGVAAAAF